MAVRALTGFVTVQVYSPASLRLAGLMTSEPAEMVILESPLMAEPPLPHWTAVSVPAVHVQFRDTFLPSAATEGTDKLTPATATKRGRVENKDFTQELAELPRKGL